MLVVSYVGNLSCVLEVVKFYMLIDVIIVVFGCLLLVYWVGWYGIGVEIFGLLVE